MTVKQPLNRDEQDIHDIQDEDCGTVVLANKELS